MDRKIKVDYRFSPLGCKGHFDCFCSAAQKLGEDFAELRISCFTHANRFEDTVIISGYIGEEQAEDFLARMDWLKSWETI